MTPRARSRVQLRACSSSRTQRILREDLQLYPYRLAVTNKLTKADKIARSAFCECVFQKCRETVGFLENVWFTDEAHFYFDARVNSQNNRIWSEKAPDEVAER